jgi:hypothetical protein
MALMCAANGPRALDALPGGLRQVAVIQLFHRGFAAMSACSVIDRVVTK